MLQLVLKLMPLGLVPVHAFLNLGHNSPFALSTRHQALSTASVGRIQPSLKRRHGVLQLPLPVTGFQFPRLFKNGLDIVVIAVVRPEIPIIVRTKARLDDLVRSRSRQTITGNFPLFTFTSNLHLVRVSARARS